MFKALVILSLAALPAFAQRMATEGWVSNKLDGVKVTIAAHAVRTDNPHNVTALQIGAATIEQINAATSGVMESSSKAFISTGGGTVQSGATLMTDGYDALTLPGWEVWAYGYDGVADGRFWSSGYDGFLMQPASEQRTSWCQLNFVDGLILASDPYQIRLNTEGLSAITAATLTKWSFYRSSGNFHVAATEDIPSTNGFLKAPAVTNIVLETKELHADSYTNLIWRTVWSNGWCYAIAFTNTP